jgi:hypothetical protein
MEERRSRPDLPDSLSVASLLNLSCGYSETHYSPLGRSGAMELVRSSSTPGLSDSGSFDVSCKGIFNSTEEAKLTLSPHSISFSRRGYNGDWWIDGSWVARTKISFWRRWIWFGYSQTTMSDGVVFRITLPLMGPSYPQIFKCVSIAEFANKMCIHMFLARPHRHPQSIFDHAEVELLERLPEQTRGVLLGEYLRVRALRGGGA